MKNIYLKKGNAVLGALSALVCVVTVSAVEWKASLVPASLNKKDTTVRLVADATGALVFYLQTDQEVLDRAKAHTIRVNFDLPQGIRILDNGGHYSFQEKGKKKQKNRTEYSFDVRVENAKMLGKIGVRLRSEWMNQSIFIDVPRAVDARDRYLEITIEDGSYQKTQRWPLEIHQVTAPRKRPELTTIGFWDYNYFRVNHEMAAQGIAKLFRGSGISFTQVASNESYRNVLQKAGITSGGNTHHAYFYRADYGDYSADGKKVTGDFSDPSSILNLPPDAEIPGVSKLVENAKKADGIATFDYEPRGTTGFSPTAIAKFKKRYHVGDGEFEKFRHHVAQHGLKTFQASDPLIIEMWKKWTLFRSDQTSRYVRRIYQSFKQQYPQGRMAITPSWPYGNDTPKTQAWGTNNAAMAPFADIIMPQVYSGYDGVNAKLAMKVVTGWKHEITNRQAKTELWPLLLVRYAGASVFNTPGRLRQQVFGSLAHGADGIMFYYPGLMDAPYWEMLARTTEEIAKYEEFYHRGERVDAKFKLSGVPLGKINVKSYPGVETPVENPEWSFTAHQWGEETLLTLINLNDDKGLTFVIEGVQEKLLSQEKVKVTHDRNLNQINCHVAPGEVGFVVLQSPAK